MTRTKNVILPILAAVLITIAFGAYYYLQQTSFQEISAPYFPPKRIAAPATTTTEQIDTSDWKVYRNEDVGFQIRYPRDWHANQEHMFVYFTNYDVGSIPGRGALSLGQQKFSFYIFERPLHWSIDSDIIELKMKSTKKINVNGDEGIQGIVESTEGPSVGMKLIVTRFANPKWLFSFWIYDWMDQSIYNKMVETFHFIK